MIDRKKIVEKHHPNITKLEPLSPLSVGNGEFAFSADITGLQTFPKEYEAPLGTQSQWGWHYTYNHDLYDDKDITFQKMNSHGREVAYPLHPDGSDDAYHWLRQNPHRLQLGQVSFRLLKENNNEAAVTDLEEVNQTLNLFEGVIDSRFSLEGQPVKVTTMCHPNSDQIGVKVVSPLIELERLKVVIRFSAPDMTSRKWEQSIFPDYGNSTRHQSCIDVKENHSALIKRTMDQDGYYVNCSWSEGSFDHANDHEFILSPDTKSQQFIFTVSFSEEIPTTDSFEEIQLASQKHWQHFWNDGAFVEFSNSTDKRANELERRVILSQYLTKIHSGGSVPPQETGYMYNSWFGKFHLEMHWWHGAQFPLWGRGNILAKSLDWYGTILPQAIELADSQGYQGARWPKMVGVDGKQTPSPIAPALIWQQPHPIAMAELCYQANTSDTLLERWKEIIIETANFMVSFAEWNEQKNAYDLGPPLIPAQENHKPEDSLNPPYELEYWKFGLEIAIQWMERLNEVPDSKWIEVASSMAKPPQADGVYLAHENCPDTFTKYNHDHPSMVGAMGILPGSLIDTEVMKNTLNKVCREWDWQSAWGWDFPMCAMTAARLGEGQMAVDFLLMDLTKNTYLPNGHNYQSPQLTTYLPGNGGLLTAVAMMACGWKGKEDEHAPGFPADGTWSVKWEGLKPIL
ncbi:glycoside hydrolase family 65 [Aquibacillus saliphilus]|uniref:glycoside hydrolase family 65 n=1 Tax=Aquibacillus saliphilus TaxID=1909422 RepID=UPI001CF08A40|nr:glycoside hydrolase family 65 [Aquibacillus saliphilus]